MPQNITLYIYWGMLTTSDHQSTRLWRIGLVVLLATVFVAILGRCNTSSLTDQEPMPTIPPSRFGVPIVCAKPWRELPVPVLQGFSPYLLSEKDVYELAEMLDYGIPGELIQFADAPFIYEALAYVLVPGQDEQRRLWSTTQDAADAVRQAWENLLMGRRSGWRIQACDMLERRARQSAWFCHAERVVSPYRDRPPHAMDKEYLFGLFARDEDRIYVAFFRLAPTRWQSSLCADANRARSTVTPSVRNDMQPSD